MLTRRTLLQSALAAAPPSRPRPNIVFILMDDLGSQDFGCYGQKRIRTPHTDALAASGMRFTQCYAGGTVCAPSRSSLMSGLHNGHAPIRANAGTTPLAASDRTLANLLQDAGYATGGFGKWGLGDAGSDGVPSKHGFDEFFGYLHQVHAHSYYPEFLWDNERKFPLPGNANGARTQYSADLIFERSLDFVKRHKDRPFFLYSTGTLPHGKFEVPSLAPYENEPWTEAQKTYAAMVTRADSYTGRLLALLKDLQLDRNTIVFLTSDNGGYRGTNNGFDFFQSNGPLRGSKGDLYEGGIRAPMIVRYPGLTRPGTISAEPWYFADVLPTLSAMLGVPTPQGLDGVSVLPLLSGQSLPSHPPLYWEANNWNQKQGRIAPEPAAQALRRGQCKVVRPAPGAAVELYDLKADPYEKTNLADSQPALLRELSGLMAASRTPPRPHDQGKMDWVR
ncbi:MAG: arylsulfatase [Acidobacteria bacterium]|nr:arylsulfatase [Acidobacteriota bacterium]